MKGKRPSERPSVEDGRYDGYRMYLRNQRIRNGFTQEYLAKRLGIARVTLTQYERGLREPDVQILVKLKKVLGAPSFEKLLETYEYKDGVFIGCWGSQELGIQ